jgi:hypothetical protein
MEWQKEDGVVLFKSIRGSHLFGLNTPESDIDTFGLFCCPEEWLLGTGVDYKPIISDEKHDNYFDELGKFIKELRKSNPEALCSLFTPPDKISYYDERLKPLWDIREEMLTKSAFPAFKGYAKSQINKMMGLNKAMNIEPDEVKERKNPLYFCWVPRPGNDGVWNLEKWLRENGLRQDHCGICRLPNGIELYTLYYDWFADKDLKVEDYVRLRYNKVYYGDDLDMLEIYRVELEEGKKTTEIKYRGLIDTKNPTTQLRLSSIPKSEATNPLCTFQYNVNAFTKHCQDYKKYWDWVYSRNQKRYESNLGHQWDAKNTMHSIRIMRMATEMAEGKGLILDRGKAGDREELLKIKAHGLKFEEVKAIMLDTERKMDDAFLKTNLPDEPPLEKLETIMIKIRESIYDECKK